MYNILVIGGAGFIGTNLNNYLSNKKFVKSILIIDNLSSTKKLLLKLDLKKSTLIKKDISDLINNKKLFKKIDIIVHLAANPDISLASTHPKIDFDKGTKITQDVIEIARKNNIKKIIFSSGSGVYGMQGSKSLKENFSPLEPISTYGASKLASEALLHSYSYLFNINSIIFRFGNVVGRYQTHGVMYDMLHKIKNNPYSVEVLGDGNQNKPYIHVDEVVQAISYFIKNPKNINKAITYNLAPKNTITVRKILSLIDIEAKKKFKDLKIKYNFQNSKYGWLGDVPILKLNCNKFSKEVYKFESDSIISAKKAIKELIAEIL